MIFFQKLIYLFFPHELTCMGSYHLLLKFPPIKHTIFFTKRQCVTSSEIWVTGQTKHRGLGGGPVCFFERDAIFLECSKANFDEFWEIFDIKFWCHTLTHGTVLRRLPPGENKVNSYSNPTEVELGFSSRSGVWQKANLSSAGAWA